MKQAFAIALGLFLCASAAPAQDKEGAEGGKAGGDALFVKKASASDLAEINLSNLALKQASDPAVKKFAQKMIDDHTKTSKELLAIVNKKGMTAAKEMDKQHQQMSEKLAKLNGAEFDTAYMQGQVKAHEMAVSLFEKQSKNGQDEDLKNFAKEHLPHLQEHLKMAKDIHGKVGGGKAGTGAGGTDR